MIRLFIPLVLGVVISACVSSTRQTYDSQRCNPPPESFSESDLIGTWVGERSGNTDTLIIQGDGRYKQIIQNSYPKFDFESEWLPWRLEFEADGRPYVHFEGMHLCAYWVEMDCHEVGGGDLIWYDPCKKVWIKMPDEGVLIVIGAPKGFKPPPRGFSLVLPRKFTIGSMFYELKEP
jgi:hypothetical protein